MIVAPVPTVTGISNGTIAQGTTQAITITGSNFVPLHDRHDHPGKTAGCT